MSTAQETDQQIGLVPDTTQFSDDTKISQTSLVNQSETVKNIVCHDSSAHNVDVTCDSDVEVHEHNSIPRVNGGQISSAKDEDVESLNLEAKAHCDEHSVNELEQIVLTPEQLATISKDDLVEKWNQQTKYIQFLVQKVNLSQEKNESDVQSSEERLKLQLADLQKKEQYHMMRLATKEHELQELGVQIEELKSLTTGGPMLKHSFLDPAVNVLFEKMKKELDHTKTKIEETQNELSAWKFTADSNTGKQLMAKCRLLIKENEELGKMISSGKVAKLEGDLSMQRNLCEELKKSQSEMDELLQEMDEDTEGMQGTILYLQGELRQAKKELADVMANGHSQNCNIDTVESSDTVYVGNPVLSNCVESTKRTSSDMDENFEVDDKVIKKQKVPSPDVLENGVSP